MTEIPRVTRILLGGGTPGNPGVNGKTILNGAGAPSGGLGTNGDFYLDTAVSDLYGPKSAGAWGSGVSLLGGTGPSGRTILNGEGAPSGGLGANGDFYLDTAVSDLYGPKTAGDWGDPVSLLGADGADGNTILSGSGPPSGVLGINGDFYLDPATSQLYGPKTAGAWGAPVSLVGGDGDPGPAGNTILNGTGAPSGGLGVDGDFYLDTAVSDLYGPKTGGDWGDPISLLAGAPGADGRTILSGTGAPSGGLGADGDFYIDTDASDLYGPKTAGAWGSPVSLAGTDGVDGAPGYAAVRIVTALGRTNLVVDDGLDSARRISQLQGDSRPALTLAHAVSAGLAGARYAGTGDEAIFEIPALLFEDEDPMSIAFISIGQSNDVAANGDGDGNVDPFAPIIVLPPFEGSLQCWNGGVNPLQKTGGGPEKTRVLDAAQIATVVDASAVVSDRVGDFWVLGCGVTVRQAVHAKHHMMVMSGGVGGTTIQEGFGIPPGSSVMWDNIIMQATAHRDWAIANGYTPYLAGFLVNGYESLSLIQLLVQCWTFFNSTIRPKVDALADLYGQAERPLIIIPATEVPEDDVNHDPPSNAKGGDTYPGLPTPPDAYILDTSHMGRLSRWTIAQGRCVAELGQNWATFARYPYDSRAPHPSVHWNVVGHLKHGAAGGKRVIKKWLGLPQDPLTVLSAKLRAGTRIIDVQLNKPAQFLVGPKNPARENMGFRFEDSSGVVAMESVVFDPADASRMIHTLAADSTKISMRLHYASGNAHEYRAPGTLWIGVPPLYGLGAEDGQAGNVVGIEIDGYDPFYGEPLWDALIHDITDVYEASDAKALGDLIEALNWPDAVTFDAGDKLCLPYAASQQINDRGPLQLHYNRGASSSVSTDDPGSTGRIGKLSQAEAFTFDGGDYFSPVATSTIWDGVHKAGGQLFAFWIYQRPASTPAATQYFAGNCRGEAAPCKGFRVGLTSAWRPTCTIFEETGTAHAIFGISGGISLTDTPQAFALSIDQANPSRQWIWDSVGGYKSEPTAWLTPSLLAPDTALAFGKNGIGVTGPKYVASGMKFFEWSLAPTFVDFEWFVSLLTNTRNNRWLDLPGVITSFPVL